MSDHQVDVVLEFGDLAACVHPDRLGEVALGHGARHGGDRAHLGGEVSRELVDAFRQALPGPGDAADPRLAAEAALTADLAGDPGHLVGERG